MAHANYARQFFNRALGQPLLRDVPFVFIVRDQ
jgi:hypothetical protein